MLFPTLSRANPALRPVVDKLKPIIAGGLGPARTRVEMRAQALSGPRPR